MEDITIHDNLTIPSSALRFNFSRSGGKGGQHVNKVSTKVELYVSITDFLTSEEIKMKLITRLPDKLIQNNTLRIVSQESRSQWQNRKKCVEKLILMLNDALEENPERYATRPTKSSRHKRLKGKQRRSTIKQLRKKNYDDD